MDKSEKEKKVEELIQLMKETKDTSIIERMKCCNCKQLDYFDGIFFCRYGEKIKGNVLNKICCSYWTEGSAQPRAVEMFRENLKNKPKHVY